MLDKFRQEEREDFIQGLRDLADWYEASTEVRAPWYLGVTLYPGTKEEVASIARSSQGKIEKVYDDGNLKLQKDFGGIVRFTAYADRKTVCTAKVVGTEEVEVPDYSNVPKKTEVRDVVEWECDPLLK